MAKGVGDQQALDFLKDEGFGFDRAIGDFELGVTAEGDGTGFVIGGGDVGAGAVGEGRDEGEALSVLSDIATVEEDVGVIGEGGFPGRGGRDIGGVQAAVAELQLTIGTVRDDMEGGDAGFAGEDGGDLLDTGAIGIEDMDFRGGGDAGEEGGGVLDPGVNDDDFGDDLCRLSLSGGFRLDRDRDEGFVLDRGSGHENAFFEVLDLGAFVIVAVDHGYSSWAVVEKKGCFDMAPLPV